MGENGGHWAAGVDNHFLSGSHTARVQRIFHTGDKLAGIGGAHVECDDPLNSDGKAKDETDQYRCHVQWVTLNELLFQNLVKRLILDYGSIFHIHVHSWALIAHGLLHLSLRFHIVGAHLSGGGVHVRLRETGCAKGEASGDQGK